MFLAFVANSYAFVYVLSVASSSICRLKRHTSSVEAGYCLWKNTRRLTFSLAYVANK